MTKTITITYSFLHRYREKLFLILIMSVVVILGLYFFLIQKAVVNVIAREKLVVETTERSGEVAMLEAKYFTMKNSITLDLAKAKGFKNTPISAYISKKPVTAFVQER